MRCRRRRWALARASRSAAPERLELVLDHGRGIGIPAVLQMQSLFHVFAAPEQGHPVVEGDSEALDLALDQDEVLGNGLAGLDSLVAEPLPETRLVCILD